MLLNELEKRLKGVKRGNTIEIGFSSGGFIVRESFYYVNPPSEPFDVLEVFKRRMINGFSGNFPIHIEDIYFIRKAKLSKDYYP